MALQFTEREFIPVLLGGDINAYSVARAFYEEYQVKSLVFGKYQTGPAYRSQIIDYTPNVDIDTMPVMLKTVNGIAQAHADKTIVLVGCGDNYVALVAQAKDAHELADNIVAPYAPYSMLEQCQKKEIFYELCEKHGVPYPHTFTFTMAMLNDQGEAPAEVLDQIDFPYPMILKPSDGIMWWQHEFEGQKKAYEIADRAELEQVIRDSYASGYTDDLILQDRVPGNDEYMRVLTSYSDRNGKVRMMCLGHVLLEDIPGVGKTTMALAFSRALGLDYGRVQFTPDVLPSDITGYSVYQKESGKLVYQPGAVLCNLFLADELNRATSRTQSARLEAMEEGQVTVDGVSHPIPQPFIVFATQNPTGAAGTQLLPDSQMDRFTVRLSIGYPEPADECSMVLARQGINPLQTVEQVLSRQELVAMQDEAAAVYIKKELVEYIVALIGATRGHPLILRGASPRATLSLTAMAKAVAYVQRRDYVVPKDIQVTFPQVIAHRLLLAPEADARQIGPEQILAEILRQVPAPRL